MFPKYDKKQFANFVTGDETWVHYFEPIRQVNNKIWATKHSKWPILAKRSLSARKFLNAIFSGEGVAIKVPVKKHHLKVLQRRSTEETKKKKKKNIIRNDALQLVLNMSVFYMTMPTLIPLQQLRRLLKKEKVTVLPHPRIPQTLPHVISFCFRNWNHSLLGGNTSPDMHFDLPCISTLLLCTNQPTVTLSRSGYIGWNFAFLATGNTSRGWNEHFWVNLKFEVSR